MGGGKSDSRPRVHEEREKGGWKATEKKLKNTNLETQQHDEKTRRALKQGEESKASVTVLSNLCADAKKNRKSCIERWSALRKGRIQGKSE